MVQSRFNAIDISLKPDKLTSNSSFASTLIHNVYEKKMQCLDFFRLVSRYEMNELRTNINSPDCKVQSDNLSKGLSYTNIGLYEMFLNIFWHIPHPPTTPAPLPAYFIQNGMSSLGPGAAPASPPPPIPEKKFCILDPETAWVEV